MKKKKWLAALSAAVLCAGFTGAGAAWNVFGNEEQKIQTTASEQIGSMLDIVELAQKAVSDVHYAEEAKKPDTKIMLKGTTAVCDGAGASFQDGVLTITEEGCYEISGTLTDGRIEVDADKDSKIEILLNGVDVTCSNYAPFTVWKADKTLIYLEEGTTNSFIDGGAYYEEESTDEKMPSAAFYSKDDLEFSGNGTLRIQASCNDGVTGKDAVSFAGGTYVIEAADDAIVGKDSVAVKGGTFTLTAGKHGIKSSKEEDEEKGFVFISGGVFDINAEADGIHAVTYVWIEGGALVINSGDDGIHAGRLVHISGGEVAVASSYEGIEAAYVHIKDGNIQVTASDDGINAADGQSVQGEIKDIERKGMMSGPSNEPAEGGNGPARGVMEANTGSSSCMILVEGGEIYVNADGDGIDSNGSIYVSGGSIAVDGPLSNGNGIFDYDGEFVVSGGKLVGAGSGGMLQTISEDSDQPGLAVVFDETRRAGTEIVIKDSAGTEIVSYTPKKEFSAAVISIPELMVGDTYFVYLDGSLYTEVEMSSVSIGIGTMPDSGRKGGRNMPNGGGTGDKTMPNGGGTGDKTMPNGGGKGGENMPDGGRMGEENMQKDGGMGGEGMEPRQFEDKNTV